MNNGMAHEEINLEREINKSIGGVLSGMSGKEKGKLVYYSMKTVASRQARKVRAEVAAAAANADLKVPPPALKKAVWSYANAVSARAGIKMKPGKGKNRDKGLVPIKRVPGWKLPILMWAADGTAQRATNKGYNRGRMDEGKYKLRKNQAQHENEIRRKLPEEVNRRVNRWIDKQLDK